MIRNLTTFGCSLAMVIGVAGFTGCEEQGLDEGSYGTETQMNDTGEQLMPDIHGEGATERDPLMRSPGVSDGPNSPPQPLPIEADRPESNTGAPGDANNSDTMLAPEGMQQDQTGSPVVPPVQSEGMDQSDTPGDRSPTLPDRSGSGM